MKTETEEKKEELTTRIQELESEIKQTKLRIFETVKRELTLEVFHPGVTQASKKEIYSLIDELIEKEKRKK